MQQVENLEFWVGDSSKKILCTVEPGLKDITPVVKVRAWEGEYHIEIGENISFDEDSLQRLLDYLKEYKKKHDDGVEMQAGVELPYFNIEEK